MAAEIKLQAIARPRLIITREAKPGPAALVSSRKEDTHRHRSVFPQFPKTSMLG